MEIVSGNESKIRKYKTKESSLQIDPGRRGHAGYTPKYDESCFIYRKKRTFLFFHRLTRKLMLMEGADACISFKDENADIPRFDRAAAKKLFEAQVIRHAGATTQKVEIPPLVYVLLVGNLTVGLIYLFAFIRRIGF